MISASYRNNNSYSNGRNSPNHHRHSRFASQNASSSSSSNHGLSSSNIPDFVYKGANKHHWAKLQSKIKQRLMAENISYIDDEEEVARRSMPPPPAVYRYFRCKIICTDPNIKKVFSFSPDHIYTDIMIMFAYELKTKFDISIDLINDGKPSIHRVAAR